jgi:hypothetical protein
MSLCHLCLQCLDIIKKFCTKSVSGLLDLLLGLFFVSSEFASTVKHCTLVQWETAGVPAVVAASPD